MNKSSDGELGFVPITRKAGNEAFHQSGKPFGPKLLDYWQWSGSDLLGNTERGCLAEYIVALDLGVADGVRDGWGAYDLATRSGVKVEVKSAAYIQSWKQRRLSQILFRIAPTHAWDPRTDEFAEQKRRQADAYVFCVLAHKDQNTIDPLDIDQWEFYVLSTTILNNSVGEQKTIGLASIKKLGAIKAKFGRIGAAIDQAVREAGVSND